MARDRPRAENLGALLHETGPVIGSAGSSSADALPAAARNERAALGALLILYLALSVLVFDQIEEDAFIYFRLVENVMHGDGIAFNRGGERIEAGSSPLWMLLLLLSWKAPWDIVITAKLLGLAAGCVSLWLVLCIARVQISDPLLRFGPPLLTVGSTPFLMWSQRGLETPLFVLIVLWLVVCCTDPRRFRCWPVPGVLLFLARPEGGLFLLGLIPVLGFDRARWGAALRPMLVVAGGVMLLLAGRLLYFHDLVPSPFYVKLGAGSGTGLAQIGQYLLHSRLFVLGSPLLLVAWRRTFWTRPRIVLGGFILIAAVWCGLVGDYMPYVRHLVPAIPLLCVLLVGAADDLAPGAGGFRKALKLGYVAIVFVGTLFFSRSSGDFGTSGENTLRTSLRAFAASPGAFARETTSKFLAPATPGPLDALFLHTSTLGGNYQSLIGEFIRRNAPSGSLIIYDQMGQTPFYAGSTLRFVDSLGLTDRTIGRFYFGRRARSDVILRIYDVVTSYLVELAFGEPRDEITASRALDYLFALDPDLILVHALVAKADPSGIPARLSRDPRLTSGYELRHTLAGLVLGYERKGTPRRQLDVPAGLWVVSH